MQPEKIGLYEVKSELGRGGMATVYRAYDPRFEREVAVKVLPSELLHADPQFRLRFEREAKIIAQLEHSAIVPVYDVGEADGQPFFVMRYMNGGSLSDRMKAGPLDVEETARILSIIAPGLDEAHSKGIVHRDIKPSNILFDRRNNPYISDFGIAKLSQAQAGNVTGSAIIGTPAYMAPEQAQGIDVDGRTDIYSLGIILYEMLTGKQPYEADTPMGVAIKHITDPVPHILAANPNLPAGMEGIIQKAMAKNKEDRYPTAVDMTDALHDLLRSNPTQTQTRGGPPMPATVVSKKPITAPRVEAPSPAKKSFNPLVVVLPVLALVILGAGGFFVFNGINSQKATESPVVVSTSTSLPLPTMTTAPTSVPTEPATPTLESPTEVLPTATEMPVIPSVPVLGKADMIAFVANNEIWTMNVDGSDLKQRTTDGAPKNDLQWLGRNTLLFLTGTIVKYYRLDSDSVETLTSFPPSYSLDAYRVSNDGKQVIIGMNNEVFVVPFDLETMKDVDSRSKLMEMQGACILPTPKTKAALQVQEGRWSADDKLVAWLFQGIDAGNNSLQADQVGVMDISSCDEENIDMLDNFPSTRFNPVGYQNREIPDFDWDGLDLFLFNTSRRNNGWGELYMYNWKTHKPTLINPVEAKCCYRDARWSPDGSYLVFAFQDLTLGGAAPTVVYYIPSGQLGNGTAFQPLPLAPGFFKNAKEAPQFALRPVE
jgi:serine/threonine protein kinase